MRNTQNENRAALGDEPGLKGDVKKLYHNVAGESSGDFNGVASPCRESEVA